MKKYILPLMLLLAACNKNDVIEQEQTPSGSGYRPATAQSSPCQNRVYEYTPAPGQFINDTATGGFTGNETTAADAAAYAERRLSSELYVSLGSFGGYIIVGFDHSIVSSHGDYDFAVKGNSIEGSNEPGIVWVMQDSNRNGKPDDVWYELRGSETGRSGTIQDYRVTYFRPSAPQMPVTWTDGNGDSGVVEYLAAYHKQDYYYPAWVAEDSYQLDGTRLEARNEPDAATGNWINNPYEWGYVDNRGADAVPGNQQWVRFKISNAMDRVGNSVDLKYIDFVKVQQGVMAQSGRIGENSCEVCSFADLSIMHL